MYINLDYFTKHQAIFKNESKAKARVRQWQNWIEGIPGSNEPNRRTADPDEQQVDRLTVDAIINLIYGLLDLDTETLRKRAAPVPYLLQTHKPTNRIATLIYRAVCEGFTDSDCPHGHKEHPLAIRAIVNDLIQTGRVHAHSGNQFALKIEGLRKRGLVNQTRAFRPQKAPVVATKSPASGPVR